MMMMMIDDDDDDDDDDDGLMYAGTVSEVTSRCSSSTSRPG